jgi:hypothetical protein
VGAVGGATPDRSAGVRIAGLVGVGLIALQLAAATQVLRLLAFESKTLYDVMVLALIGFPINALLPLPYRKPFFALLSVASVGLVFGFGAGAILLGLGAVVIGACHVPVAFRYRLALVGAVILVYVALRVSWISTPIPPRVWPIFGAMFMLRLFMYLHAVKHREVPVGWLPAAAYFLMLPNVCFPWFPLVDYKTFHQSHFDCADRDIYQRGIRRIARGLLLMAVYRVVYHQLVLDPSQVHSLADLAQYVGALFLGLLKLAGQFYLIVGILHLFGFHLPDPYHRFLLSSTFADIWRRNNIPLKDYMQKLVYFPSFFKLRGLGRTQATLIALALVFVLSWALHSFAWFWVLGYPLLTATDVAFWAAMGVLVCASTLSDLKTTGPRRRLAPWDARLALGRLRAMVGLAALWAMWSGESLREFVDLLGAAGNAPARDLLIVGGGLLLLIGLFGIRWATTVVVIEPPSPTQRNWDFGVSVATLAGLWFFSLPQVQEPLGPRLGGILASMSDTRLNARDAQLLNRNYYDQINAGNRLNSEIWGLRDNQPADWVDLRETPLMRARSDFQLEALQPSVSITYKGQPFSTNRWAMRDRDYAREKVPGTYRIALVGPSDVLGTGVGDGEAFEALVEERLNRDLAGRRHQQFEVLNFGEEAYSLLQMLYSIEERVEAFHPDLVLFTAHEPDPVYIARHLARVVDKGYEIPYPEIREIAQRAGLAPAMSFAEARRRMNPHFEEIATWTYGRLRERTHAIGARSVVLLMREPTVAKDSFVVTRRVVAEAGIPVIDLLDAYPPRQEAAMRVAPWDRHPNKYGHQALATALLDGLARVDSLLQLGFEARP